MKRVLEHAEVEQLLGTFSNAPCAVRNRALVVVLWRSGLRIGEALDLRPADLDRPTNGKGWIAVRHGKGDSERVTEMPASAWDTLDRWLTVRRKRVRPLPRNAPVFCTLRGRELSQPYVRTMLRRKARQAGLDTRRVHPHAFRHAFAVELHRNGTPIDHVRRLLGHSSLGVTGAYLARIDPDEVLDSARALDTPEESEIDALRRELAELRAKVGA